MNSIQLQVSGRAITATSQGIVVAGSVQADTVTATFDSEWTGLTIIACFEGSGAKIEKAYTAGMAIPWECIADPGYLEVAFEGFDSTGAFVLRTRRMLQPIYVANHGPMEGDEEQEATRSIVAQCIEATSSANSAASSASSAATSASSAASSATSAASSANAKAALADSAASSATSAASSATSAASDIEGMTASATTLEGGSSATAQLDKSGDEWVLRLGIPRGISGEELYWCTYGDTLRDDIRSAISSGKTPVMSYENRLYICSTRSASATSFQFFSVFGSTIYKATCSGSGIPAIWTSETLSLLDKATSALISGAYTFQTAPTLANDAESDLQAVRRSYVDSVAATKQDAISDLATIRSGAAAGATALQDAPSDGKTYGRKDGSWSEVTGGGTEDHAQLTHLDYASSGHTGFASSADLAAKQDAISDLSTIRSGAAAGATAYQKPATGIPKTDLASTVQSSLDKADTALQSHQSLAAYRTSAAQDAIDATKQDTITSSTDLTANSLAVGRVTDKDGDAALAEYVNGEWYLGDARTPVNATDAQYFTVPQVDTSGAQDQAATMQYVDEHHDSTKQDSLSAAQLAAANSGITTSKVTSYDSHVANADIHVTSAQKSTWSAKQDAISDLSTIRSGAAAGATAYQKPATGIPKSDLASAVQTSLDKADTALQSHQSLAAYRTSSAQDVIDAGKAQAPTKQTATINVADWSNKTATCAITGLRVDSDLTQLVHCVFSDNATMLSAKPWFSCSTAGTLTITCQGDVPTAAVTVAVVMQEV